MPRTDALGGPSGRESAQVALAALAVLLAAADTYVVVLALPEMMSGVGLGLDQVHRGAPILSIFLLGYVVVLALAGRVSDVLGRTPVIVACLVTYAVGCLITAGADTLVVVLVGRGLQGLGAGGLVPPALGLVADLWPSDRRSVPLGVIGAAQELGTVLGPLLGAAVLAVSGWRTIFWLNLAVALVLWLGASVTAPRTSGAARLPGSGAFGRRPTRRAPRYVVGTVATVAAAGLVLLLQAPAPLVGDVTFGTLFVPMIGDGVWASPLGLGVGLLGLGLLLHAVRQRPARLGEVDLPGAALLGVVLAGMVLAFAEADPTTSAVADGWPWMLGTSAVAAVALAVRLRTADHPLIPAGTLRPRGAWGSLVVNLLIGAALVAALVDVPVFARQTRYPGSQLGAAMVLLRLLVALPVGALAGGWLARVVRPGVVAATGCLAAAGGMALMSGWDDHALDGPMASVALVLAGLGFGLAVAPVNTVLLAVTRGAVHGLAGALGVLARMVGMLVGLSLLTAVGLRVFYARQAEIGNPLTLCPQTPLDCPAYVAATRASALEELRAVFAGGAGCALIAAVLCLLLLTARRAR